MDYIVYGVAKSWTPLSNSHFHFHFLMKFSSFLPFYNRDHMAHHTCKLYSVTLGRRVCQPSTFDETTSCLSLAEPS